MKRTVLCKTLKIKADKVKALGFFFGPKNNVGECLVAETGPLTAPDDVQKREKEEPKDEATQLQELTAYLEEAGSEILSILGCKFSLKKTVLQANGFLFG